MRRFADHWIPRHPWCEAAPLAFALFLWCTITYGDEAGVRFFSSHGASITIDESWNISARDKNSKLMSDVKQLSTDAEQELKTMIESTKILLAATKGTKSISLIVMPAEASQEDMAAWDEDLMNRLRDAMHRQAAPQYKKLAYRDVAYEVPKMDRINGNYCFVVKSRFRNGQNALKATERRYFYFVTGTFLLTVSNDQAIGNEESDELKAIIQSLRIEQ
jgi:hypothetical protein